MAPHVLTTVLVLMVGLVGVLPAQDDGVLVREKEGSLHGFLALTTLAGTALADGELVQRVAHDTVRSRMELRFHDGSRLVEMVAYLQDGRFRMLEYHLIHVGPAFDDDLEAHLWRSGRTVVVSTRHEDGEISSYQETLDLPPDVSNGLPIVLARNLVGHGATTVHLVAFTPKPRLIGLELVPEGGGHVGLGSDSLATVHFTIKPKLGVIPGFFASILGKKPPDSDVWVTAGDVPAFLRFQGPLYMGPVWRLSLVTPTWR